LESLLNEEAIEKCLALSNTSGGTMVLRERGKNAEAVFPRYFQIS